MAPTVHISYFCISLSLIFHLIFAIPEEPISPNALFLHVSKDPSTLHYVTQVSIVDAPSSSSSSSSSQFPTLFNLVVIDLSSSLLWVVDCETTPLSSSKLLHYYPFKCCSLECLTATTTTTHQNLCGTCTWTTPNQNQFKICSMLIENPITNMALKGELNEGNIGLGESITLSNFLFSCAKSSLLKGIGGGSGVKGILGLGNSRIALPLQAATKLGISRKFALCLSSSNGVIISGESESESPFDDISKTLLYTTFTFIEREGKQHQDQGYYINVKSININGKKLALNKLLFKLNQESLGLGVGSTLISTTVAYTSMDIRIYEIFTKAYIKAAKNMNLTMVSAVEPFGVCFSSRGVENVPIIDLVLQSEMVKWKIYGRNSMVHVNDEVMCLGYLNGGLMRSSIVIGGYQLEDNFLEFNLETSMLGFSSSLLKKKTSCSNLSANWMLNKDSL